MRRALALGLVLTGSAARAQGARIVVEQTQRANPAHAERELSRRRAGLLSCFLRAQSSDAQRLSGLRRVLITVWLGRGGRATTVRLDPPLLSPGLSECVADALLPWDQGGRPRPRAWVRLRLDR